MSLYRSIVPCVLSGLFCLLAAAPAQDGPGALPRPAASAYPAHADHGKVSVGATFLTKSQMRYLLLKDLRNGYVVVEAAVFPTTGRVVVRRDDFALIADDGAPIGPVDPAAIVAPFRAVISSLPNLHGEVDIGISIGNSDPYYGRPGSTGGRRTTRSTSVSVGTGGPRSSPIPVDDELASHELAGKALPEGATTDPVAGYLYFPTPKRKKKALYTLEHTFQGATVSLELGLLRKK